MKKSTKILSLIIMLTGSVIPFILMANNNSANFTQAIYNDLTINSKNTNSSAETNNQTFVVNSNNKTKVGKKLDPIIALPRIQETKLQLEWVSSINL